MHRSIYNQGHFESACMLYAAANTVKSLTGQPVTRARWREALDAHPLTARILQTGTLGMDNAEVIPLVPAVLESLAGAPFAVRQLPGLGSLARLAEHVTPTSVVLFTFSGDTEYQRDLIHWVCAVAHDADPLRLHIACSSAFGTRQLVEGTYDERRHPAFAGRLSNDSITPEHGVALAAETAFRVALA